MVFSPGEVAILIGIVMILIMLQRKS